MTKVDFTDWLHSELNAVFHGDITPEQVMINAIPMIDLFVSKNCGKPIVSGSLPLTDAEKLAIAWKTLEWVGFRRGEEFDDKDILEMLGGNDR